MTVALSEERIKTITDLLEDAKSMAETIDELRETNLVLAVILVAGLDTYLLHIREQVINTIGVSA